MKNFTKQNFKTNPLWIRLLIMTFMLLMGTSSAWAWGYKSAGGSWNDCTSSFSSITYYTTPTGSTTKSLDVIMKTKPGSGFNICQNACSGQQLYVGLTGTASSSANTIVRGTAYWNNGLYSTYTVVIPEGKIYIKPTGGSAIEMTKSSYTYTASVQLSSAKTFDLYANDPGASISNENSMPSAGKPSSVRLNYTGLSSPYQYVKVSYDLKTNKITFTEEAAPCTPPAAPTFNPNSTTVCSGTSFTLPSGYRWYTVETGGTKLSSNTISAGVTAKTIYYAEAGEDGCVSTSRTAYTVNVNDKPAVPTLSVDKTSLIGDEKAIFTVGNTVSGLTYTLYNGETAGESQTSTGSDLTFKAGGEGSYTVRVSNSCGTSASTPAVVITVCTPQVNEFRHANSSYTQLANQPTYYPGDKAYFVSTNNCCLTGTWSANLQKGEEAWWTGLTGSTPKFSMTLTRAGEFTITNMATNGCTQNKNVLVNLDFTVTALSEVTNANGTASGANIALTWNHSATHSKVMVVRYPSSGTETIPAGGQAYTEGNTLGGGTVVYVGTAGSCTDKNLPAGASYKYYFYTVNNNYYSEGVVLNMSSCPTPAKPSLSSTAITACNGECTAQGYITINNMNDYKNDTYTFKLGSSVVTPDANGRLGINSTAYTQYTVTVTNSCGNSNSAEVEIAINDNAPIITGNTSFQPNGSTTLTSDKGASTTWVALDGGDLNTRTGASVVFTAKENGTYHVQATYNDCSTTITIKVQDDLYVWVRRPIKKEKAYEQFYHEDQNSDASIGGDLFYKEFASLPGDYQQYNQGGKAADKTCTDKDGYKWYGFVVSKTAIENDYYFTVHAPNNKGYGGYHTHTYATQLVDMDADLYFVMDETPSNLNRGWNINTPVVVRASGDAMFNGNNFADFVPLYVKDANTCDKEVVSFEWQKSDSQNGAYTTYKSGKGINNIRTREAGWYRCVVTYGDGKGTATSNAIQVTNAGGTAYSFTSNLPIVMVNTNGVGFPDECKVSKNAYPSSHADDMKAKISVDVIIKKGDNILYDKKARMNYRGSSSLNFKKKSYAFVSGQDSCVFDKSRHDYVKTKKAKMLNILGVANYEANDKDWVMYAATADPSMIRNRLVFDLYQKMRPQDWGVHSTYVELVVDGVYKGVYVFMDKITANEKRVNITNPNGFIVKWDKTDCADRIGGYNGEVGDEKTFKTTRTGNMGIDTYDTKVDQLFEIEYPEKEDIEDEGGVWSNVYQPIIDRFEAFEEALATKNYVRVRDIIDYDSWADWFILNEFTKNLDAYRASCIFTYSGAQGDKIKAVPLWDQELSFNNAAANISGKGANSTSGLLIQNSGVYSDVFPAPFWFTGGGTSITGGLLNDPCFISIVKEKWATYTAEGGVLTSAKVDAMVDAYKADLGAIGTAGTPIYRENAMIPFNDSSNAGRGSTSSCTASKAIGYFGYGNNCGSAVTHDNSITAIKNWVPNRITNLTSALNGLEGEALIFTLTPTEAETTPWVPVLFTVNAPQGYEYSMDYSKLPAGAVIKEGENTMSVKLPQPANWPTGGDGTNLSEQYTIKAILEADGGTSVCGTTIKTDKTSTITLKQTYEDCTP